MTDTVFHQRLPPADLVQAVKCFWEVRLPAGSAQATTLVVPDGSPELVVELGCITGGERAVAAGQLTRAFELGTPPGYHAFGIRLQPWGGMAWLGDQLPALTDRSVAMADVLGAPGRRLAQWLGDAADFDARIEAALRWLRHEARPHKAAPGWLPWAAQQLAADGARVAGVAARLGLSTRQMERVFLRGVGLPPKAFARQQRFARATRVLDAAPSLAALAQACGYADQAHMARDFRAFAGLAPSVLSTRLDAVSSMLAGLARHDVAFVQAPAWAAA